jgi:hypothetical protein
MAKILFIMEDVKFPIKQILYKNKLEIYAHIPNTEQNKHNISGVWIQYRKYSLLFSLRVDFELCEKLHGTKQKTCIE